MDIQNSLDYSDHLYGEKIIITTLATMIAAFIVILAFYPLECIEGKMQVGLLEKTGLITALRNTEKSQLYKGCAPSVIGHMLA